MNAGWEGKVQRSFGISPDKHHETVPKTLQNNLHAVRQFFKITVTNFIY